jgi:hypothetical protein
MPARKPAPYVFAAICLAMAGGSLFYELDGKFIGLVLLAASPWIAPQLLPFLKSLKFGGMELTFADLEKRMKKTEQVTAAAANSAAGKAPGRRRKALAVAAGAEDDDGGPVPHGIVPPPMQRSVMAPPVDPMVADDDPNKGQFGGQPERGGFRLAAEVTPVPQTTEVFLIHAWVEASAGQQPLRDGAAVLFHLHPTFEPSTATVTASGGTAALDRLAWGAFTLGVEVEGVRLELDLAKDVLAAPSLFRSR